jgi:hypothetical protein
MHYQSSSIDFELEELLIDLSNPDADTRIKCVAFLSTLIQDLSSKQKDRIANAILPLLYDNASSDFAYGIRQCDEEEIGTKVADVVADTLMQLGYKYEIERRK